MERDLHSGKRNDLEEARLRILGKRTLAEIIQDPTLQDVLRKYPRWVRDVHHFKGVLKWKVLNYVPGKKVYFLS